MSRPNVKLRHLQQFLAVARSRSLTQAARELGTAQPAVSRTIRELEDEVGAKLFERGRRATVLTPRGMTLQSYVQPAMRQIEEGLALVSGEYRRSSLSVMVLPSANRELMPRAVARFKAGCPEVELRLETSAAADALNKLRGGEVDFIFGRIGSMEAMHGVDFLHLYTEPLLFIARAGHPLAGQGPLSLEQIAHYQLLLPERGPVIRLEFDRLALAAGLESFDNVIETLSFEFMRSYVLGNDAIAFCPRGAVSPELLSGELVALDQDRIDLDGPVGITTLARRRLTPPARMMVKAIREVVDEAGLH